MAGKGTYSDLGHEYGHVRGAQDLYQYMIPAENNPVSHVAYDYPKCNMGTGYQEWSDYCSAIFNHNAQYKQITADMTRSTYPKQMLVRVTKDGKPVQRATVNFWGSRATFKDIYAEPGNSPYMKKKQMQTVNLPLMIYIGCLFRIIIILRIFPLRVRLMNFLFHAGIVL